MLAPSIGHIEYFQWQQIYQLSASFCFQTTFPISQFKSSPISQPLFIVALFSFASNYLDKIVAREGSKNINLETTKVKVATGHLPAIHWV